MTSKPSRPKNTDFTAFNCPIPLKEFITAAVRKGGRHRFLSDKIIDMLEKQARKEGYRRPVE